MRKGNGAQGIFHKLANYNRRNHISKLKVDGNLLEEDADI